MLFAQITDLHCTAPGTAAAGGRVDTNARLAAAIAHLNRMDPRPEFVLVTGDLANGPAAGEYGTLAALLPRLAMPAFAVPGNHDDRAGLRSLFPGAPWMPGAGFVQFAVDRGPLRILMLDTLEPGRTEGRLCAFRLAWIAARLEEHPGPVVVAMHHPPFATGVRFMDRVALQEPDGLAALVRRHGNVQRVLCGHVHRSVTAPFAGTVATAVPATAHQLALELGAEAFPRWTEEPPVVALHAWSPAAGLVTHLSPVGPWRPQPFARA